MGISSSSLRMGSSGECADHGFDRRKTCAAPVTSIDGNHLPLSCQLTNFLWIWSVAAFTIANATILECVQTEKQRRNHWTSTCIDECGESGKNIRN